MNRRMYFVATAALFIGLVPRDALSSRESNRATAVAQAWAGLDSTEPCCEEFSEEDFPEMVTAAFKSRAIRIDRARAFGPDKSFFYGYRLPEFEAPYYLQVGSGTKYTSRMGGYPSAYFFEPSVVFLDADMKEIRRLDTFSCKPKGWIQEGEMGYFGLIRIESGLERYVVVSANPQSRGKSLGHNADASLLVTGMVIDFDIPFGPDGFAEARIAKASTVKMFRRKSNGHCKVVE